MSTRVGTDVTVEELEKEYDAVLWALGCQSGRGLPVPGWEDTPNCVSGVAFLKAFNEGRMKVTADKVVCVGGGDTSVDVVSVARRLGHIEHTNPGERPESIIHDGYVAHDTAVTAAAQGADVTLTSLFHRKEMMAAEHEVHDALTEGVTILDGVMPLEVIKGEDGRAKALKVCDCTMDGMKPIPIEGTERVLEADLIVSAIGQGGDLTGLEDFDNGRGLMNADKFYQVPDKPGHFVAGDIIRPHLLTTAIGQASIAADSIDEYVMQAAPCPPSQGGCSSLQPAQEDGRGPSGPWKVRRRRARRHARYRRRELGHSQLRGPLRIGGYTRTTSCSWAISRFMHGTSAKRRCRPPRRCSVTSRSA